MSINFNMRKEVHTIEQKQARENVFNGMENDPNFEFWIFTNHQDTNSCIENSPRAKKPRLSKSLDKPMRIVIFLTVIEFDDGQNINQNNFHCGSKHL